jgi:hypothetical protein
MMFDKTKIGLEKPKKIKSKPEKRLFNGHEYEFCSTTDSKNRANAEARKQRKRGFHTRVIDLQNGMFSVYRRPNKQS